MQGASAQESSRSESFWGLVAHLNLRVADKNCTPSKGSSGQFLTSAYNRQMDKAQTPEWQRFESAVHTLLKAPPQPKTSQPKKAKKPAK